MAKRSLFKLVTGGEEDDETKSSAMTMNEEKSEDWMEPEGNLTVDVYQTPDKVIVKTLVAGVKPEDLDVTIARDSVVVRGKRESHSEVHEDNYIHKELYWGSFSRTVILPVEVEPEEAEAVERHGLLIISIPKIDKSKQTKLKIRSNQ